MESQNQLTPTQIVEDLIFNTLVQIAESDHISLFCYLFKNPKNNKYDRAHIIHHITKLPIKTARIIEKNNIQIEYFFSNFEEIFNHATAKNIEDEKLDIKIIGRFAPILH